MGYQFKIIILLCCWSFVMCTNTYSKPEEEDYFTFTLNGSVFDRVSTKESHHYKEPGWTIMDSRNREVDVYIDIPSGMRRQETGNYEITYTAIDRVTNQELGTQRRIINVINE